MAWGCYQLVEVSDFGFAAEEDRGVAAIKIFEAEVWVAGPGVPGTRGADDVQELYQFVNLGEARRIGLLGDPNLFKNQQERFGPELFVEVEQCVCGLLPGSGELQVVISGAVAEDWPDEVLPLTFVALISLDSPGFLETDSPGCNCPYTSP